MEVSKLVIPYGDSRLRISIKDPIARANKIDISEKGVARGVATLDDNGKIPASQLPSYVDDVIEGYFYEGQFYRESDHTNIITPETGKIYIDLPTNKSYRWSGSRMVEIAGGGGSVDRNSSIRVNLIAYINDAQGSATLLNGTTITLVNTTHSTQVDTRTWDGQEVAFDNLTPLEDYQITVTNPNSSIWYVQSLQKNVLNIASPAEELVTFEYWQDEYTISVLNCDNGKVVISGTEYSDGDVFKTAKGSTVNATAKSITNYDNSIVTTGKTITATYVQYGSVTVSTLSNQSNDSTIAAVTPTVKINSSAATPYTGPIQVSPGSQITVTWPDVAGYKKPAQRVFTKTGNAGETITGTYQTEVVTVTVSTDETGVTAQGQTVTINGSNYQVGASGVVTAKVAFDTVYSISANEWQGQDTYSVSAPYTNITASIASRNVSITYTKARGAEYTIAITDNQNGASNAATNARATVKYTVGGSEVVAGTNYKNGDTFLVPDGATNITVTGSAIGNFAPVVSSSSTTYTITYKAQKVSVSIRGNSTAVVVLKDVTADHTVNQGTSDFNGFVAWDHQWKLQCAVEETKYPSTISPAEGRATSATASAQVEYSTFTLITTGEVDLGLPSKNTWAACNIGASTCFGSGLYFSWGNTEGHAKGSGYNFNQTTYDSTTGASLTENIAPNGGHDAARVNMDETWRMPTISEIAELFNPSNVDIVEISSNDGSGILLIGKSNLNAMFIPAGGYYDGTTLRDEGTHVGLWSSDYYSAEGAKYVYYNFGGNTGTSLVSQRRYGRNIRAVKGPVTVDMGNGVKWATGNLTKDANGNYLIAAVGEKGAYFSWGNIDGHNVEGQGESYDFSSSAYSNTPGGRLSASFTSGNATYDAARANLGSPWRIPTYEEFDWLYKNCTWKLKIYDGQLGYEGTSKINGNKLLFPLAARYEGTSGGTRGYGYYRCPKYYDAENAYSFSMVSSSVYGVMYYDEPRWCGESIRPVQ